MIPLLLGKDIKTGERLSLDPDLLRTHFHFIGATGSGKSTAIQTILRPLLANPRSKCCLFLLDPIGNLSRDLLAWIAHPRLCPQHVRERLLYIEPARDEFVLPFNPLTYTSEGNRYYQTMRAVDIVLRAWAAQDVTQQPRLLQWTYKAFCAAAMMGLPIAMCRYLLHPGTDEHRAILDRIPGDIRSHWSEILKAKGSEPTRILESTRNRLDPFFESSNLRRMFGARASRFDCERLIRDRRIVIVNLGKYGRIPGMIADTIGGLMLNEIIETANRLSTEGGRSVVDPTYVVMDEFQKYVSVDVEDALPTVRQMGLRLLLAHQSFAQLEREDVDLTQMIWQARSRLVFANSACDADILADELAKLTFDPLRVKDMRTSVRQIIVGYRKEWLESESSSRAHGASDSTQESIGYKNARGETRAPRQAVPTESTQRGDQRGHSSGHTHTTTAGDTRGRSQANVPIHDTFDEVSSITYQSFEEFAIEWGQNIRRQQTGEAFLTVANDGRVRPVQIDHLPIDVTPALQERIDALLEKNFANEYFISAAEADGEAEACRQELLQPPTIVLPPSQPPLPPAGQSQSTDSVPESPAEQSTPDPFRKSV